MQGRVLFATIAAVVAAGSTASAAGERSARAPDLSSRAAIDRYLASTGVSPGSVVHQSGLRNYAGPSCPGAGWTCTRSTRVAQIALPGGVNRVECAGADCVAVQGAATQEAAAADAVKNSTRCKQSTGPDQSCEITQVGTDNDAQVDQDIRQRDGTTQTGTQKASVEQHAPTGGSNSAHVRQTVDQDTKVKSDGAITQDQAADQDATVDQDGSVGADNAADVDQVTKQTARAHGKSGAIQQTQQGSDIDQDTPAQTSADIEQHSDTGENRSKLRQRHDLDAQAKATTGDVTQTQGASFEGGLDGTVTQDSAGVSTSDNDQHEKQRLKGDTNGTLTQSQHGPASCCSPQTGNPNDTFNVKQSSDQKSDVDDPDCTDCDQDTLLLAHVFTDGTWTFHQQATTDTDRANEQSSGTGSGSQFTGCSSGSEGGCVSGAGGGPIGGPVE